MRRVTDSHGFTIVETLIFLAVSGVMFVSAMLVVGGQQARTEFRQSAGEFQALIDDTANDVATGYYLNNGGRVCGNWAGVPFIWTGTAQQGTQQGCIMMGRVIQFGHEGDNTKVARYNVAGVRQKDGRLVQTLVDAQPDIYAPQVSQLLSGMSVASAYYQQSPSSARLPIGGIAILSSLAEYSTTGGLTSGLSRVELVPMTAQGVGASQSDFTTSNKALLREISPGPVVNPSGGFTVCLDSGGTDQHIVLRFGVGGSAATEVDYRQQRSANDAECTV
jgi:Tfp pilus assembly protein FimT